MSVVQRVLHPVRAVAPGPRRAAPARALRLATLILLLVAAGAPARAETFTCGGLAPVQTSCTTGRHTRTSGISQDVAADVNYAGTIETSLVWSGGARVFRCTYTQALRRSCLASGSFPPVNASFTHRCRSIVPGTVVDAGNGISHQGVEGGGGTWQCLVVV